MSSGEIYMLFVLPFAVMTVVTLGLKPFLPESIDERHTGRLADFNDFHREAYVGGLVAAVVTIAVFEIKGGPEPFVLFWLPLLSTIMVLPFAYITALIVASMLGWTRR